MLAHLSDFYQKDVSLEAKHLKAAHEQQRRRKIRWTEVQLRGLKEAVASEDQFRGKFILGRPDPQTCHQTSGLQHAQPGHARSGGDAR